MNSVRPIANVLNATLAEFGCIGRRGNGMERGVAKDQFIG